MSGREWSIETEGVEKCYKKCASKSVERRGVKSEEGWRRVKGKAGAGEINVKFGGSNFG